MSELQFIEQTLARAASRRRKERALRGLWLGLLVGASLWLVAIAVYKVHDFPLWVLAATAGCAVASVLAGLVIGGWRSNSVAETARWVDGRQHLQERLSSALEMARAGGSESWRQLLVTDAASHAKGLDPRGLVQFRLPKATKWALIVLALSAGLGFVPEYRSPAYKKKMAEQKVIADAGRHLVELTKRSLESRTPALESTQKTMEAVQDLGEQLMKKAMTRDEALKDLAKMTDKLKDDMKEFGKDPALKRMEQAARANRNDNSSDPEALQKQIDDAQKKVGANSPDKMEDMKNEMAKIEKAAQAAMSKDGKMSEADKEKLSQSLATLSKQAQDLGMQVPNLDQAIEALAANQTDMFLKDLQASMTDLEKMRDMAKDLQRMQAEMEKIGKDLGEQLDKGQAQAAQATLKKMIDQLKSSNLSSEQLDKMMSEVSKAIDPASRYGKVADFLKQGAQQMKDGQKPGAAQSLADASKELDKLMQQMGDAQAMLAELDALNKASQCVGTCQGWGMCQGDKIGWKPGGKPGKGVGTWADENSWGYNGQQSGLWDNSGVNRPDMEGKGITDRGDPELNDALKPTKVKGSFSPGGQMPSITLKGVSIKGESKVELEAAAVAAQADAQAALSQDKVPRAYQGAVRDYFDDLKK
jgi:hypothetical protein